MRDREHSPPVDAPKKKTARSSGALMNCVRLAITDRCRVVYDSQGWGNIWVDRGVFAAHEGPFEAGDGASQDQNGASVTDAGFGTYGGFSCRRPVGGIGQLTGHRTRLQAKSANGLGRVSAERRRSMRPLAAFERGSNLNAWSLGRRAGARSRRRSPRSGLCRDPTPPRGRGRARARRG